MMFALATAGQATARAGSSKIDDAVK